MKNNKKKYLKMSSTHNSKVIWGEVKLKVDKEGSNESEVRENANGSRTDPKNVDIITRVC